MKRILSFAFAIVACVATVGHAHAKENRPTSSQQGKQKMKYEVKIVTVKTQPTLAIKGKAKMEEVGAVIGKNFGVLEDYMKKKSISPVGAPYTRTFVFEAGVLEFETGFPVQAKTAGEGEIISSELPGGKAASTVHVGSQQDSQKAYEAIEAWIKKNKKQTIGAPWEVYLTDASQGDSATAKMQVFFPIK